MLVFEECELKHNMKTQKILSGFWYADDSIMQLVKISYGVFIVH